MVRYALQLAVVYLDFPRDRRNCGFYLGTQRRSNGYKNCRYGSVWYFSFVTIIRDGRSHYKFCFLQFRVIHSSSAFAYYRTYDLLEYIHHISYNIIISARMYYYLPTFSDFRRSTFTLVAGVAGQPDHTLSAGCCLLRPPFQHTATPWRRLHMQLQLVQSDAMVPSLPEWLLFSQQYFFPYSLLRVSLSLA